VLKRDKSYSEATKVKPEWMWTSLNATTMPIQAWPSHGRMMFALEFSMPVAKPDSFPFLLVYPVPQRYQPIE